MWRFGVYVVGIAAIFYGVAASQHSAVIPPAGAENSVVIITAEAPFALYFGAIHGGTGFALAGHIYTCAHVIHGANKIIVTLRDGKQQRATLLRVDEAADLAELDIPEMPRSLLLRDYAPRFFEKVWEIGNPGRLQFVTTTGYFLTFDGEVNIFLIDTWMGNSGSPIMDNDGRVIGMTHTVVLGTRFTGGGTLQQLQNFVHPGRPR